MFVTSAPRDGLSRVTYWRFAACRVAFRTVSQARKRRMIIFRINLRAIPATARAGELARRAA
jgi:hypothetical protein